MFSFIREELYMLHANLQGLQAAARQLLFHAGQRELPGFPSARPLLLLAPSRQPASVRGPLHPHSQLPAELRLQLLPQLHQRPRTWYDLYSGLRQVMWEKNHGFRQMYSKVLVMVADKLLLCVSSSVFYIFWGIQQKKLLADRGTVLSTLRIFLWAQILTEV